LAWLLAWPSPAYGQTPPPDAPLAISAAELKRLAEISTQLAQLNATLKTELDASRTNSAALAASLASSREELERLRIELAASRQTLTRLSASAANSETESAALRIALTQAESSWRNLETSFADYRSETDTLLASRDKQAGFWRTAAIAAAAAAAVGWALCLVALIF
jgi:septal ring factor EnvC (AmiA/AmiB activator)